MTQPSSKVICDSVSPDGVRLITHEVVAHRWILAEINTHRALSKNYRSSRAVPTAKLLAEVRANPALPIVWMKNKPGMQATEPMTEEEAKNARWVWESSALAAADNAELLLGRGLHKQWVNRILEPYLMVNGVITATDWANFYARRRATDAQPEFEALADAMWEAQEASVPKLLRPGEWHLPYVDPTIDGNLLSSAPEDCPIDLLTGYRESTWFLSYLRKLSAARCARVSIKPFDEQERNVEADLALHDRLWADNHPSPFEHQATPDEWCRATSNEEYKRHNGNNWWKTPEQHKNFYGWCQYRATLPGECVLDAHRA